MQDEHHRLLTLLGEPPARLTADEAAVLLHCQPHDLPVLVAARLLKPLGNPAPNSTKYFSTNELRNLTKDRAWLVKMTDALSDFWRKKNQQKKSREHLSAPVDAPRSDTPFSRLAGRG